MRLLTSFRKYWEVFQISWQNGFAYPVSVLFWRLRQILPTFMSLTIWSAIFASQQNNFGYTKEQMITYIFLIGFLQSIILATVMHDLSERIYTGQISYVFMMPANVFLYLGAQEVADKTKNFGFILIETCILFSIFHPTIVIPHAGVLLLTLASSMLGAILLFLIMMTFGAIGFWSNETWGPRFLFYMFIDFTAGKFFPINIFPPIVQKIIFLTPFPYFSYVQTQVFLEKYTQGDLLRVHTLLVTWIAVLFVVVRGLWRRGLREYGAMGH